MNNETILKKAIDRAEKNGFNFGDWVMKHLGNKYPEVKEEDTLAAIVWLNIDWVIYDHSFAKAFWKKDLIMDVPGSWQYHLQQLVLEKDPLKYLEQFI